MKLAIAKRLVLAALFTAVLLLLLWHTSRPQKLIIQGRSLDQHILLANNGNGISRKLLDSLTPDAIPHLTMLLRSGASPVSRLYLSVWLKVPPNWRPGIPPPQYDVRPDVLALLTRFGPAASGAVNGITNYLAHTEPYTMGRHACFEALYAMGPFASNAIPILLHKAAFPETSDPNENFISAFTLATVGQGSRTAAAELALLARGTNAPIERIACALASHSILPDAKLVAEVVDPFLLKWLEEAKSSTNRNHLARTQLTIVSDMIGNFGSSAQCAAEVIRTEIPAIPDRQFRNRLLLGLQNAGGENTPEA